MGLEDRIEGLVRRLDGAPVYRPAGRVTEAFGTVLRATVGSVPIGEICVVSDPATGRSIEAEVVGFAHGSSFLAPLGPFVGLSPRAEVLPTGRRRTVAAGYSLMGRVVDGLGQPMDGRPLDAGDLVSIPLATQPPDPLARQPIEKPFPVGIRAIDALLTCGEGQRVGIFGEPGAGKSTLLGALINGSEADVCVVGLVGERGREVGEFLDRVLGPDGRKRSVVVVSTSDRSAMDREAAAQTATAIAEYFRDEGLRVLLVIDSITRYARALRDIGLAAGEVPTRRGFPPSVFARLPVLLERGGMGRKGSITAFHTVLVEGDGTGDPIAEEVRSILDGHIVLSAELAARNHYPAIDVLQSKSRVASAVAGADHLAAAGEFRSLLAAWREVEFLVQVGEYKPGSDPIADRAIAARPAMEALLRQAGSEATPFDETLRRLNEAVS